MAIKIILSNNQQKLLFALGQNKLIQEHFYFTGGTALAEFYLHHRYSEDLDFFSEQEVDPQSITTLLKSLAKKMQIKKVAYEQSFNRKLFFLHLPKEIIKTEFTYFPFPRINLKKKAGRLAIDSLLDIAVNKIFTIYQNPRSRDFIDLFFIIKQEKWTVEELVRKAKIKFDWHIDWLQLGSQFLQATVLKDYPRLIKKIKPEVWQNFFVAEGKKLKNKILKSAGASGEV